MSISVRTRFEIFKRDSFTCQYCGRKSPGVVLEIDHIVPKSKGGSNDPINLTTSCWGCNSGKSDKPLGEIVTGEDPHDRAIMLLEKERQLHEYNAVLAVVAQRVEDDSAFLIDHWERGGGVKIRDSKEAQLENMLQQEPLERVLHAMNMAIRYCKTDSLAYVRAVLKNSSKTDG